MRDLNSQTSFSGGKSNGSHNHFSQTTGAQKHIPLPLFPTDCEIDIASATVELTYKIYVRNAVVNLSTKLKFVYLHNLL